VGVLAIMIRGIRISALLFVTVRNLLVLNVILGHGGQNGKREIRVSPWLLCWYYRISESHFACSVMIMFMYLIAVSDHNMTMTAGLLQMAILLYSYGSSSGRHP
jgi:hypothetical protein